MPKRPSLGVDADTNSAQQYYAYAVANLTKYPERAADGFFWAAQLDPTSAQPLYGRRVALLLMSADVFFIRYMNGDRAFTHTPDASRIDSLELHARMLDPLFERELEKNLVMRYLEAQYDFDNATRTGSERQTFDYYVEQYLRTSASPYMRAVLAVSDGRMNVALRLYRDALMQGHHAGAEVHMARGEVFHILGNDDSARVEMELGLDSLRGRAAKDIVHLYESKSVFHHGIGLIWERAGLIDQARQEYMRALQEDPRYYPAHLRLGLLALAEGDTTTALSELALAEQIKEDEPVVQTTYGAVLVELGHLGDADRHLHRAAELDPFYAAPYYALGRVAELAHRPTDAVQHYRAYLARAAAQEPRAADVRRRLADLQASSDH
ncbi:MAG TPA: tetratricopeptide repeat protein [Gemmatimonadales bacterium]|nr:tetratricopeptide repeat protein [Gemmatimonadales bacterium]